ncbi:unnamed protein product [Caenorhabditis nigoni]
MGHRSSRTAPEHVQNNIEEDRHSAWGSDIDETFCGPGKICGDNWTPLNSLAPTPESQRRSFRIDDDVDEGIITEQPGFFKNHSIDDGTIATNFDVMTIHEEDFQEIPTIVPVRPRRKKKKKKLRRKPAVKKLRSRKLKLPFSRRTAEFKIHDVISSMSGESVSIKILAIRRSQDLKEMI